MKRYNNVKIIIIIISQFKATEKLVCLNDLQLDWRWNRTKVPYCLKYILYCNHYFFLTCHFCINKLIVRVKSAVEKGVVFAEFYVPRNFFKPFSLYVCPIFIQIKPVQLKTEGTEVFWNLIVLYAFYAIYTPGERAIKQYTIPS